MEKYYYYCTFETFLLYLPENCKPLPLQPSEINTTVGKLLLRMRYSMCTFDKKSSTVEFWCLMCYNQNIKSQFSGGTVCSLKSSKILHVICDVVVFSSSLKNDCIYHGHFLLLRINANCNKIFVSLNSDIMSSFFIIFFLVELHFRNLDIVFELFIGGCYCVSDNCYKKNS